MKLTGKCKEDFEKWLKQKSDDSTDFYATWAKFYILSNSAKYGVYVDFFENNNIFIFRWEFHEFKVCLYDTSKECEDGLELVSETSTRAKAIIKANEIYNNY